jgi:hypothetical protein
MHALRRSTLVIATVMGLLLYASAYPQLISPAEQFDGGKAKYRDTQSQTNECLPPCGGGQLCC